MRHNYPKDFDEKIKDLLESQLSHHVQLGILMLLSRQGFYVGRSLWAQGVDTHHPILHIIMTIDVSVNQYHSMDQPSITVNCLDVMYNEKSELGVPMANLIAGEALALYSYSTGLQKGIEQEEYRLRKYESMLSGFLEESTKLDLMIKAFKERHRRVKKELHNSRKRLSDPEVNQRTKEQFETIAAMHKRILSEIMVIKEDDSLPL